MTLIRFKIKILQWIFQRADWILPPNVKNFFKRVGAALFGRQMSYRGLHHLPYFLGADARPFWEVMNGEYRPTIAVSTRARLMVQSQIPFPWIQIGFGVKYKQIVKEVNFSIDGALKKSATHVSNVRGGPEDGQWTDLRIPLDIPANKVQLEIITSGESKLFISHPITPLRKTDEYETRRKPPTIICIILDGIEKDFLTEQHAPFIQAFFRNGVTCEQSYAQGDWTLTSFSSMLTGLYPHNHGVYHSDVDVFFPSDVATLPELLLGKGYRTFGYSGHKRFAFRYGHAKGFERFIYRPLDYKNYAPLVINEAIEHLESHRGEANFMFLHFFDTHYPFLQRSYYPTLQQKRIKNFDRRLSAISNEERMDYFSDMIPSKLKATDLALQALFSYLDSPAWKDNTVVILTSDHGTPVYDAKKPLLLQRRVHIPLFVRDASLPPRRETALIEGSVDLFPSILRLAGADDMPNRDGRIWPFLGGAKRETAFTESLYRKYYSASLRDNSQCVHFKCPFDLETKTVNFSKGKFIAYRRESGQDQEETDFAQRINDNAGTAFLEKLQSSREKFTIA